MADRTPLRYGQNILEKYADCGRMNQRFFKLMRLNMLLVLAQLATADLKKIEFNEKHASKTWLLVGILEVLLSKK